ncbi:MAG: hypothetical protein N2385_05040 [Chloroflexus sp.]|nr:hypothetical protein [Chloroflexus sp.]
MRIHLSFQSSRFAFLHAIVSAGLSDAARHPDPPTAISAARGAICWLAVLLGNL